MLVTIGKCYCENCVDSTYHEKFMNFERCMRCQRDRPQADTIEWEGLAND